MNRTTENGHRPIELLTAEQVSAIVGLDAKTLYNQRAAGRLPGALGFVPFGRAVRWNRATVEAYIADQEAQQVHH